MPKATPKVGLQSGEPPVVDPVISREKALKLIGLFTKNLGDLLSALHKKQGTYVQLGYERTEITFISEFLAGNAKSYDNEIIKTVERINQKLRIYRILL